MTLDLESICMSAEERVKRGEVENMTQGLLTAIGDALQFISESRANAGGARAALVESFWIVSLTKLLSVRYSNQRMEWGRFFSRAHLSGMMPALTNDTQRNQY